MKVRYLLPLAGLVIIIAAVFFLGIYANPGGQKQTSDKQAISAASPGRDERISAYEGDFKKGPWFEDKRLLLPTKLQRIEVYQNKERRVLTPEDKLFKPVREAAEQTILSYNSLVMSADLVESALGSAKKGATLIILHYGDSVTFEIKGEKSGNDTGNDTTNELFINLDGQPENDNVIKGMFYVRQGDGLSAIGTSKPFTDLQAALKLI